LGSLEIIKEEPTPTLCDFTDIEVSIL